MAKPLFVNKIDVDTERGTRIGVPNLVKLYQDLNIPATFLFCVGPDNTGWAIKRVLRPGFFKKISRTSIIDTYGIRTLLNGTLLPAPHIGKKHAVLMRSVRDDGFDIGIHAYDHCKWQDGVTKMPLEKIQEEFQKATQEFERIFNEPAKGAGAPGWQANEKTFQVYDDAELVYGSDCRGKQPFIPKVGETTFKTLQIPTTLPTLDELIGRPEFPIDKLTDHYLSLLKEQHPNVMTSHAELEGMKYLDWHREFLLALKDKVEFTTLLNLANETLQHPENIPICEVIQAEVEGRSGKLAIQK